jgi:multidrug resistance protein
MRVEKSNVEIGTKAPDANTDSHSGAESEVVGASGSPKDVAYYSKWQQRKILFLVSFTTFVTSIGAAIYLPLLADVKTQLKASQTQILLTLSLYTYILGLMTVIWGSLSDVLGRKWITFGGMLLYTVSALVCGFSTNIHEMIVFRLCQAIGAAAPLTTGSGVVREIFPRKTRGRAMGLYSITPILGVSIGPVVGGLFDLSSIGWRGAFYCLAALSMCMVICILFFLPETLIRRKDQPRPKFRPWIILRYLKHFSILTVAIYNGLSYGAYYAMQISLSSVLDEVYALKAFWIGLAFLPVGAGVMIGNYSGGYLSDYSIRDNPSPSNRLIVVPISLPFFTILLIILGLIFEAPRTYLALPILFTVLSGFFYAIGRPSSTTFAVERAREMFKEESAGGVSGLIFFFRFVIAATLAQLLALSEHNHGIQWYLAVLAILVFLSGVPLMIILFRNIEMTSSSSGTNPYRSFGIGR